MEFVITENEDIEYKDADLDDADDAEEVEYNEVPVRLQKPRQITYDDILGSLNMKVVNGKLQMTEMPTWQLQQQQLLQQKLYKSVNMNMQQQQQQQQQQYQNQHQIPVIEKQEPMTPIEYKRHIIINHLKRQAEMQRINKLKSRKLLFPESNISISSGVNMRTNNIGFRLR